MDPAQLEAAILNLAVNARDAMVQGGELTIETANVELDRALREADEGVSAGPYVMVSIADTGTGMTPEVAARAFEPFFTTKEVGKGTGLGLSMIYGFANQSNGHVKIHSEAGHGTVVKLYLPRTERLGEPSVAHSERTEALGGVETILIVEDDAMVHTYVTRQIKSLGYQVLSAHNGLGALEVLRRDVPIDLLFTDVVMPGGMDGPELVVEARRLRPDLKVLYTSGYTENSAARQRKLDLGVELLSKPYRRHDLAAKLRKVLDQAPRGNSSADEAIEHLAAAPPDQSRRDLTPMTRESSAKIRGEAAGGRERHRLLVHADVEVERDSCRDLVAAGCQNMAEHRGRQHPGIAALGVSNDCGRGAA